jgi:hypothetical protein
LRGVACSRGRGSLSNDVPVSDVEHSEDVNGSSPNGSGVLANLPRARPQRSSARRLAARERNGSSTAVREQRPTTSSPSAAASKTAGETRRRAKAKAKASGAPAGSPAAKGASATGRASAPRARGAKRPAGSDAGRKRTRAAAAQEPAPRQGFESESETPTGSLQPPGGVELVASAAELVGELAKAGLSRSERLLKDVVSRLPLS